MRVKELTLQGFKSFAAKHRFVFPSGVTAVVGPNGSGKSNIADAIRWVLGEQRAASMRARRTEDMIFAGSERRARSGLAEVSLMLDNEARWLDLDFSEVVVTRRATRDGSNTYLINGAQVRLRDVQDLLAGPLGQGAYTVIGQGLVDSALSLRPDERRVLIDEAAGIVPLQRRRTRALQQLAETEENLTRVDDILSELGPQLKRMSRLADRAVRFEAITSELRELLTTWYGYRLSHARRQREARQADVDALQVSLKDADTSITGLQAKIVGDEDALAEQEAEVVVCRRARGQAERELAEARQAVAVSRERLESLRQRERDLETEAVVDTATLETSNALVERIEDDLEGLRARDAALQAAAASAREALQAGEASIALVRSRVDQASARLHEARAATEAVRQQMLTLDAAQTERAAERSSAGSALEEAMAAAEALAADVLAAEQTIAALEQERDVAAREERQAAAALAEARERATTTDGAASRARAALESIRARLEAVSSVVDTADAEPALLARLQGTPSFVVRGTVASLLQVEPEWADAVAAALGPLARGLVVADDAAVDGALAIISGDISGQLALVPIESGARAAEPERVAGESLPDIVARSPSVDGLVQTLLGGTVFVDDVDAARKSLARPSAPHRVATRDGRLVLPGGTVVAGSRETDVLRLGAERRELEGSVQGALASSDIAAAEAARAIEARETLTGQLTKMHDDRLAADRRFSEALGRRDALGRQLDLARQEQGRLEERCARLDASMDDAVAMRDRLTAQLAEHAETEARRAAEAESAREGTDQADVTDMLREAGVASDAAAASASALATREAELNAAQRDAQAAAGRLHERQDRLRRLADETEAVVGALAGAEAAVKAAEASLETAHAALQDADREANASRQRIRTAGVEMDELRRARSASESALAEARVTAARADDALEHLGEQMHNDLDLLVGETQRPSPRVADARSPASASVAGTGADAAVGDGDDADSSESTYDHGATDGPAPAFDPPPVDELPDGLEDRVAGLRRQLRAVGAVDQEALASFRETEAHFDDLTTQNADLEAAASDLMTMISQLESDMSARFERTFGEVAAAFRVYFPQLFGGGEADLVLMDGEDEGGGIDITARPPGKRRQPLSLLSGGERALTAVALVFALLHVSRTPFVVLDEVDAALDEANVDRFCGALTTLAEKTQVVIVTHNRGTIEAADTVYGITMAEDGASQAISLQVGS